MCVWIFLFRWLLDVGRFEPLDVVAYLSTSGSGSFGLSVAFRHLTCRCSEVLLCGFAWTAHWFSVIPHPLVVREFGRGTRARGSGCGSVVFYPYFSSSLLCLSLLSWISLPRGPVGYGNRWEGAGSEGASSTVAMVRSLTPGHLEQALDGPLLGWRNTYKMQTKNTSFFWEDICWWSFS